MFAKYSDNVFCSGDVLIAEKRRWGHRRYSRLIKKQVYGTRAQNDTRWGFPLRMMNVALSVVGIRLAVR